MSDLFAVLAFLAALAALIIVVLVWLKVRQPVGGNLDQSLREEMRVSREESGRQSRELREEVTFAQSKSLESLVKTIGTMGDNQRQSLKDLEQSLKEASGATRSEIEKLVKGNTEALKEIQKSHESGFDKVRLTLDEKLREMTEDAKKHLKEVVDALQGLEKAHQKEQQIARDALDKKFQQIQESNEKKLEEMRQTVDEKLHSTLEKRLGESFKLVSERLEAVQSGLGEMKNLATGVGDLKRVLTNVKDRGTWGEYQLEGILTDLLTPDQFERNVQPKEGGERVEFALKLPGKGGEGSKPVWLPIDAKFPKEDYERLVLAADKADGEAVKTATKALADEVRRCARDIHDKYISPPATTDFAVMFLPTEGLYAEVLRQPGLHDELQRKYRVLAAGPTTLAAMLNSLRIGFQTLAIEKRASEVWTILSAVKTEFGKFGEVLDKVKNQLNAASTTIDKTAVRTRAMERKLREVEQLPTGQAEKLLGLNSGVEPVPPNGSAIAAEDATTDEEET